MSTSARRYSPVHGIGWGFHTPQGPISFGVVIASPNGDCFTSRILWVFLRVKGTWSCPLQKSSEAIYRGVMEERTLAGLIDAELRARGTTLREFARLARLDHSTLSKLLRHGQHPSAETIRKLAPLLGRSADELLAVAGYRVADPATMAPPRGSITTARDHLAHLARSLPFEIPVNVNVAEGASGDTITTDRVYWSANDAAGPFLIAVAIRDDGMAPLISPGDIAVIDTRQMQSLPFGALVAVTDVAGQVVVRWLVMRDRMEVLASPNCDPVPMDHGVSPLGVVVQVIKTIFPPPSEA